MKNFQGKEGWLCRAITNPLLATADVYFQIQLYPLANFQVRKVDPVPAYHGGNSFVSIKERGQGHPS